MIVGFAGQKHCGKDTAGRYLVAKYGFESMNYAHMVKVSFAAFFDIPLEWIETYKDDPTCMVAIGFENDVSGDERTPEGQPSKMWSPITKMTLRQAIQRFATEAHRNVFGESFWVDQLLPNKQYEEFKKRDICITDARFRNELERIRSFNGINVRIHRPTDKPEIDTHRSETELLGFDLNRTLIDYRIQNDGTIEEFHEKLDLLMHIYGVNRMSFKENA